MPLKPPVTIIGTPTEATGFYFGDTALAEHQAVIEAIAAGDAAAARAAMHRHLQQSHDRFAGTWPQPPPASLPGASPTPAPPSTPSAAKSKVSKP